MPTTTAPDTDDATEEETEDEYVPTSWEFIGTAPTVDAVRALLEKLPEQWGVAPVDFLDFVQALPAKKKIKRQTENDRGRKVTVDEWVDIWSLYMTVAGRIAMLNRCAEVNRWRVDLTPEPGPDGRGGYVELGVGEDGRIVYREACIIYERVEGGGADEERLLGTKSGTAWNAAQLPGESAKATSPFEKVETAARGRAIAAWGIGILPGSGVASVEEMQNRAQIERGQQRQQQRDADPRRPDRSAPRKTREELIDEAYTIAEDIRQRRGEDKPIARSIIEYGRTIGVAQDFPTDADDDSDDGTWEVDWSMWNDGKITQLVGALTQTQRVLIDRDSPI